MGMDFPRMVRIRQQFDPGSICNVSAAVRRALESALPRPPAHGKRVAITAGSRGITDIVPILKEVIGFFLSSGGKPFLFPAMGSHGSGTSEGQRKLLEGFGITEEKMGVPILSEIEPVRIGEAACGLPVFADRFAAEADHIVVVNRIKPHTKFKAPIESGLMKMMAIGMGKRRGAEMYHKAAVGLSMHRIIMEAAAVVLAKLPILCGLGIVENGYDRTAVVKAAPPSGIEDMEKRLLRKAKKLLPKLPFDEIDVLIVDRIGKDISGIGMDPNITGRNRDILGVFPHPTRVKRIFVRDLSPGTHGNAVGIGLADLTTRRAVEKIDYKATYTNCLTAISLEKAAVPMHFDSDREALTAALGSIGLTSPRESRVVRILDTLHLAEVEVSESFIPEALNRPDLTIVGSPSEMVFDDSENLPDSFQSGKPGCP